MNEKTNWGLVMNRPLISSIPAETAQMMSKSDEINRHNGGVGKVWGKTWMRNIVRNRAVVDMSQYGIYNLLDRHVGQTAFLFGAGPSLAENIMDYKDDAKNVILTSTHSLKYLLGAGIRPSYVGVVDAYARQAEWADVGNESKGITLLMDVNCSPRLMDVWKGPIIFFKTVGRGEEGTTARQLYDVCPMEDLLKSGGNVMTAMISAAHLMGMKKFVFVGHDYAMGADHMESGVNYADGSLDVGKGSNLPLDALWSDLMIDIDIQGLGTGTLGRMLGYKHWTESAAQIHRDCEFINATEAGVLGAYPEGNLDFIKQMRLKDV
jgi:hypothetical protein